MRARCHSRRHRARRRAHRCSSSPNARLRTAHAEKSCHSKVRRRGRRRRRRGGHWFLSCSAGQRRGRPLTAQATRRGRARATNAGDFSKAMSALRRCRKTTMAPPAPARASAPRKHSRPDEGGRATGRSAPLRPNARVSQAKTATSTGPVRSIQRAELAKSSRGPELL